MRQDGSIGVMAIAAAVLTTGCAASAERGDVRLYEASFKVQGVAEAEPRPLGEPMANATAEELRSFEAGKREFLRQRTPADGLGPVFNDVSCAACHLAPAIGGGDHTRYAVRFGTARTEYDELAQHGGGLLQDHGIGLVNDCDFPGEKVPGTATVQARRRTTPTYGLGLVGAVPYQALRDLAEAQKRRNPRTAGEVAIVAELSTGQVRVGKYGWKAQQPTLFQFASDALVNEMGITSPDFPREVCPQGDCARLKVCNPAPGLNDPDGEQSRAIGNFMRFLAPPPRGEVTPEVEAGEAVFAKIGCADCHTPTMVTGYSSSRAHDRLIFHPYGDFLLHDMGTLGDGVTQNNATGSMMRTAPLWGLRFIKAYLHDGRASSVSDAILMHDGQGKMSRDEFLALTERERQQLLAFLDSL
jgi:CxxC motif-containing protein (DUF1111 family)